MAVFVAAADSALSSPFIISPKGLRRIQDLLFPTLEQWRRTGGQRRGRDRMNDSGWDEPPPFEP
jgi:hypothetical protein